ncbi:hypothetical protein MPTK2_1g24365 [Marchantia polymorpha subsp. ruderalis]
MMICKSQFGILQDNQFFAPSKMCSFRKPTVSVFFFLCIVPSANQTLVSELSWRIG